MTTKRVLVWPAELPPGLTGLYEAVAALHDAAVVEPLHDLCDAAARIEAGPGDATVLVAVPDAAVGAHRTAGEVGEQVMGLGAVEGLASVLVVGDGWLGTDADDLGGALVGSAAVTTARSIAVRRGGTSRANVVAVPQALFGVATSQRGPLRQPTELADIANAAGLLLSDAGGYLSGQVLFVDGGRHLFSSLTA